MMLFVEVSPATHEAKRIPASHAPYSVDCCKSSVCVCVCVCVCVYMLFQNVRFLQFFPHLIATV